MEENKNCGCGCEEEQVNSCGCGGSCGCGDEMEEEIIYVTFDDESDAEVPCAVLDIFECDGREYIAITPKAEMDSEDDAEVYFYRYSEDGEEVKLDDVETDEEWAKVADLFDQNFFGPFDDEE